MTAKLYGQDARRLIVELLTAIDKEEQTIASLADLQGDSLVRITLGHQEDYVITIAELRSIYQSRIADITNKLMSKNIELANAPDAPLQSIARAHERIHHEEQA